MDISKNVEEELAKEKENKVHAEFEAWYSSQIINAMFFLVFATNILINVDHGVLPGIYKELETKIGIGDFYFGLLGSIVYGGLVVGSAAACTVYTVGSRIKPCLIYTSLFNILTLILFT